MNMKPILWFTAALASLWVGEWAMEVTKAWGPPRPWFGFPLYATEYVAVLACAAKGVFASMPK